MQAGHSSGHVAMYPSSKGVMPSMQATAVAEAVWRNSSWGCQESKQATAVAEAVVPRCSKGCQPSRLLPSQGKCTPQQQRTPSSAVLLSKLL